MRASRFVVASAFSCATISLAHPATAATPAIGSNGQGTLLIIGDSLTVGTDWFGSLQANIDSSALWEKTTIDAKVGRLATDGAITLGKRFTNSTTAIAIALGTNDMISRRDPLYPPGAIDKVMSNTRGLPTVWFNINFSPTGRSDWRARGRRFNRALRDAQSRWPNLIISDWYNDFTPSGKMRYIADGVHLNVSGYKYRAKFMLKELKSFGQRIVHASTTTTTFLETTTTAASTTTVASVTTTT